MRMDEEKSFCLSFPLWHSSLHEKQIKKRRGKRRLPLFGDLFPSPPLTLTISFAVSSYLYS